MKMVRLNILRMEKRFLKNILRETKQLNSVLLETIMQQYQSTHN